MILLSNRQWPIWQIDMRECSYVYLARGWVAAGSRRTAARSCPWARRRRRRSGTTPASWTTLLAHTDIFTTNT